MSLDPKLHFAVFELLRASLLRIRDAGWRGDAARCAIEADHVHNLPGLLESGEFDLAKFYWNTERAAFIHQLASHCEKVGRSPEFEQFAECWSVLERGIVRDAEKFGGQE